MLSGLRRDGRAIDWGQQARAGRRGGFYSLFFGERETFFGGSGLHTQANTRPAARPPSGQSDIPRKGNLGGGTTWPASPIFFQTLIPNCQSIPITAIKTLAVTRTSPIEVGSTYLLVPMRTTGCNAGGAKKRQRVGKGRRNRSVG